ncbi:uncharacterized protein LOC144023370 [Festucalex cinctus]
MDLWHKNKELLPQYTRYDTVPGRNYSLNHYDRHQATYYPADNHEEQRTHVRESSYWTLPRSRTGRTLLDHTKWPEPQASTSQHRFIWGQHSQQNMGDYESCAAREWTTAGQVVGAYERDKIREGWQRRWEPSNPVRYRESFKRDSSSYRELEAWAARYSHSLPRRRRIEAELRGGYHGLLENRRTGIESCMVSMQQVGQCANTRDDPGQRERAIKQQTYGPPQAPNASQVADIKGKIQTRMFSQPPGYVAPPPYNSPHKGSPVMPHSWEQFEKTQKKPDIKQKTSPELEEHTYQRNPVHKVHIPHEVLACPQTSQEVKTKIIQESSSKVIEGRKFRLSKETGGMTIFCLVSRIAGPTEHPSFTPCDQANTPRTELGKCAPISSETIQTTKVADEVDHKSVTQMSALTFGDRNLKPRKTTPSCVQTRLPEEELPKKDKTAVCPFKEHTNDAESTFERRATQPVPPVSAKYPLWREPSLTRRTLTQSPLDMEVRRLDIKEGPETVEGKDVLVIDTTCVVVRMELIKSPKKEHVHLLGSTMNTEQIPEQSLASSSQSCGLLSQELHSDQNNELNPLAMNKRPKNNHNPDHAETTLESENENTTRESFEKRAERILGIHLHTTSLPDMSMKDANKELDSPGVNDSEIKGKLLKGTIEEEQSQSQQDQSTKRMSGYEDVDCDNFSGSQQLVSNVFKEDETKSQFGINNVDQFDVMQGPPGGSTQEVANPEQSQNNKDVTPPPVLPNPLSVAASKDIQESNVNLALSPLAVQSLCFSEPEIDEALDAESRALDPIEDQTLQPGTTSLQHMPTLIPIAHPSTLPSDAVTSTTMSDSEVCEEDQAEKGPSPQHGELSDVPQESPNDRTDELVIQQQLRCWPGKEKAINIAMDFLDQNPGISHEKPADFNTEEKHLCIQTEEENRTYDSDKHSEKMTPRQTEKEVSSLDFQEVDVKPKETNAESPEDSKDLINLEGQTAECQSDILPTMKSSPPLPADTNHEAPTQTYTPPQQSREDFAPHSETESACPSTQNHNSPVELPETLSALLLGCTPCPEKSLLFPPPPEQNGSIPQGAELDYPNSLWDAVNRIRKHTAPDSENEEEEVFEFWDPESVGVDLEQGVFEELGVLADTEIAQIMPQPLHEEDTLSCSSTSSHDSGDTVIIADEDDVEETEEKGGRCCLVEVEHNIACEEDGDERKYDENVKYQTADDSLTTKDKDTM